MNTSHFLWGIGLMAALMVGCDKVELPLPEPEIIVVNDSVTFPTVDTAAMNRDYRMTYVEEFTGHKCITCPANTALLLQQIEENKERMIAVSVHAGGFAEVDLPKYPTDFNTEYGTQVFQHYNMATQPIPSAIINRRSFGNFDSLIIFNQATTFWEGPIDEENTNTSTDFAIGLEADYIDSLDLFYIKVSTEVLNDVDGEFRLLVLCVEDSVIAEQIDARADPSEHPDNIVKDYVHRHVLRKKLNPDQSLGGDPLISGAVSAGTWFDYELNATMPENVVNKEKTHIIAVLTNVDTEEVMQSIEVHTHVK